MKNRIVEYTRDIDGHQWIHLVMVDLDGVDHFRIECIAETPQDALMQLIRRLQRAANDAADTAGDLLDKCWIPSTANSSSRINYDFDKQGDHNGS